jgi:Domain of unknown function (DUF4180)
MVDEVRDIAGVRVLVFASDGAMLTGERDINTFISEAWAHDAAWVAIPVARLGADFFRLSTKLAGEVAQKFVNYKLGLAIVGDISEWVGASRAMHDFVYEANNGRALWFVGDLSDLERRLKDLRA